MRLIALLLLFLGQAHAAQSGMVFQAGRLAYEIGTDGQSRALRDPRTGKDYLLRQSPFMSIDIGGRSIGSTSVTRDEQGLRVGFGDTGVEAHVMVRSLPGGYLTFELVSTDGRPTVARVELLRIPVTLTKSVSRTLASCRDDEYGAAVVPLNKETHSSAEKAVLVAEADSRVRLAGAKAALVGGPAAELLTRIERIERDQALPHPTLGGVWARKSPEQMRSYLFVDLSETTAGTMIDYARAGKFGYIVVYDGVWNSSHGTYTVNRKNFPNGETGLKEVSARIHAAGLKFGMHNLDMVVDKTDALVHPAPAAGFMMYPDRRRTLAADINAGDTFIPSTATTAGLLAKADKSRFHGRDLRIGDEIITYDDLQTTAPFGFTGCKRGAHGTTASAHPTGTAIDNFSEFIDYYRPDIKSDLYDRIARAAASALDTYGFDYIYPDGTGENLGYWPEQPEWYIYNLLISKLFSYTKREVMWAHAPITDYSWHIFSRGNTTDYVHTGVMQHFDRASVAGAKDSMADLQPFEFGWFGFLTHALDARATRPREMEYAWAKALAWGAAMSLETNKRALDGNGRTKEIFGTVSNWEELKLNGYFPATIREQMKAPGKEFALERPGDGRWRVLPVTYSPEHYSKAEEEWNFDNPHDAQPVRLAIEARPVLSGYGAEGNIALLDPARPLNLYTAGSGPLGSPSRESEGVAFALKAGAEAFEISANNRGDVPQGWGCAEVILDGLKDLRQHRALGAWVEGDGSGAYLHFIIEDSGRWSVRDYYVRLDFKGKRYVEIPESAKGEVYDFAFPYSNYWAIRNINFKAIGRVYVFLSGLKPGTSATARFSRLEALRETPAAVRNPVIRINGEAISFAATLETDWYLEYEGAGKARVFDQNGFQKAAIAPQGAVPLLRAGLNRISVSGETPAPLKTTLSSRGRPLR
jgi:hypothetical protein